MSDEQRKDDKPPRKQVAIFGAGIAGLTAAHELIERGYEVEVYEATPPSPMDELQGAACAIGGMARTQWSRTRARYTSTQNDLQSTEDIRPRIREVFPVPPWDTALNSETQKLTMLLSVWCKDTGEQASTAECAGSAGSTGICLEQIWPKHVWPIGAKELEILDEILSRIAQEISDLRPDLVELRGFCLLSLAPLMEAHPFPAPMKEGRLDLLFSQFVAALLVLCYGVDRKRLRLGGYGLGHRDDWSRATCERNYVTFSVFEEDWIPGEHGFRFFPGFYRNLFDTMRRTPIAEDREAYIETGRSVLSNIEPTRVQGFRFKDHERSFSFPRRPPTSLRELFDTTRKVFQSMRFTLADIGRFELKLFQYMTSSPERRAAEYENQSWWEFLGGDGFSEGFQHFLEETPQTLLALRSTESDARTYGNIQVQMLLDQFGKREITDGTLNGPTSEAWFDHWRRYLESQGVRFHCGKLIGFDVCGGNIWPKVVISIHEATSNDPNDPRYEQKTIKTVLTRDRYVVAVPANEIQNLIREHNAAAAVDEKLIGGDLDRILGLDLGDPTRPVPGGEMAHMSGIQFYFDRDVPLLPGHTAYSDAEWGLSSISQPQFWTRRRGWWDGYRGLLSVDVCTWHQPGYKTRAIAWNCSKGEIAREIWEQIAATLGPDACMPIPNLYHLDENIEFATSGPRAGRPARNKTPFMISRVGVYPTRPGRLDACDPERGYEVHFGSLVFAGTFMQTFTRMTTMEAANESGRHAVNGILEQDQFKGSRCNIANPEDQEIDDLRPFVDLDRELHKLGLPHFLDILGIQELPPRLLEPDPDFPNAAAAALRLSR